MAKNWILFLIPFLILFGCRNGDSQTKNLKGIERLMEGNKRFVEGKSLHLNQNQEARIQTIKQQKPFAVVVACSDSRVNPSIVLDHGIGDLFVIRTAGNLLGELELASIEYAIEHLGVEVVLVMGHENCGAITAYVNHAHEHGHIQKLIDEIAKEPEEKAIENQHPKDRIDACIRANIQHQKKYILESEIVAEKLKAKKLEIFAAEYSQKTGKVTIIN